MISHEHECIFIPQRKCASSSICVAFNMRWSPCAKDCPDWHFGDNGVNSHQILTGPPYFRFSIVRNPYDRFISGWKFCEKSGSPPRSLLEWLSDMPTPRRPGFFEYDHIARPQHVILLRPNGSIGVDYLMRYENLQDDFDRVCDLVGKTRLVLPHVHRGDRQPYRHYFDACPEARRLLEQHFQRDLELFNYSY
jgi:hypothetical protein